MFMSVFKTLELFITESTSISIQFQLSPHILEVDLLRQHWEIVTLFPYIYKGIGFTDKYIYDYRNNIAFNRLDENSSIMFNYRKFKNKICSYMI